MCKIYKGTTGHDRSMVPSAVQPGLGDPQYPTIGKSNCRWYRAIQLLPRPDIAGATKCRGNARRRRAPQASSIAKPSHGPDQRLRNVNRKMLDHGLAGMQLVGVRHVMQEEEQIVGAGGERFINACTAGGYWPM